MASMRPVHCGVASAANKNYSVNDGGESRHEPCVFLYEKSA